jgi:hypothetical protein
VAFIDGVYSVSFRGMIQWHASTVASKHGTPHLIATTSPYHLCTTRWRTLRAIDLMARIQEIFLLPTSAKKQMQ